MAKEVELLVEHEVRYTNAEPIPVKDVVQALLGLERISSQFLPRTLNALMGTEVRRAELLVEGFEHGSLVEKMVIRFLFTTEQQMNDFVDKLRQGKVQDAWQMLPGNNRVKLTVVGITLAVLVGMGVHSVLGGDDKPASNTVIIIGAEAYGKSPDQVVEIVRAAIGNDRKRLAQETANFIAPAKADPNGSIVMDQDERLTIPAEIVRAMPRQVEQEPYEYDAEHKDVDLEIRASDRDSGAKGWAGVVPGLLDRRVRLVLGDDISPNALANRFHVRADIIVKHKLDANNQPKPVQIYVERIIPDEQ